MPSHNTYHLTWVSLTLDVGYLLKATSPDLESCLLTYMQSTLSEMPGWMKNKLESRLLGEISITSDTQMTPPLGQKVKRTEEPLDDSEKGEQKMLA